MNPDNHRKNMELLRELLATSPGYVERDEPVYDKLFEAQFTPCCVPLGVMAWVNPANEGIFVRIVFPSVGVIAQSDVLAVLNEINVNLPIGAFVLNEDGEVRFKSAVFIGDTVVPQDLLAHLFGSAGAMVRAEYSRIIQALTGTAHQH